MNLTVGECMKKFNCSRNEILEALKETGYSCRRCPKKTVLDKDCIAKLRKYFYEKSAASSQKPEIVEKIKTLDEYMAEDFQEQSNRLIMMINESLGFERIVSWKATAETIDFNYGCNFEFLRSYFPDLYRIATDAEDCFKTIELKPNFVRYCMTDVGVYLELVVSYVLNRNGWVKDCLSMTDKANPTLNERIKCLVRNGIISDIIELFDESRKLRNKIHVKLTVGSEKYIPDSLMFSFQKDITPEDCRICLRNMYVLGKWLIRQDKQTVCITN